MTVCKYFLAGTCKFGDRCNYEHPKNAAPSRNRNAFGPLQYSSSSNVASGSNRVPVNSRDNPYKLDKSIIITDLSKERPQWILSAYGPGIKAPTQLFGGYPREQSFEELRYYHYGLAAQGNHQQAIQEAQILVNNAEQQIKTALGDVEGAIKYIIDGEKQHPNRIDIVDAKGAPPAQQASSQHQQITSTFSQNPSAAPAFGQPSAPSAFRQSSASAFGQSSVPVSAFSQPSAFGQPASLGRPTVSLGQPTPTFGNPSLSVPSLSQTSSSSQFGGPKPQPTAFGGSSTTNQTNSAFGQPAGPTQPSSFGLQPVSSQSGFFGRPAALQASNPFGRPETSSTASAFGRPATATSNSSTQNTQPPNAPGAQSRQNPDAKISNWKGRPVSYVDGEPCYKANDGVMHRIWFPHGPPVFTKTPELPEEAYTTSIKNEYVFAKETGGFRDGIMPETPPMRAWCSWDF